MKLSFHLSVLFMATVPCACTVKKTSSALRGGNDTIVSASASGENLLQGLVDAILDQTKHDQVTSSGDIDHGAYNMDDVKFAFQSANDFVASKNDEPYHYNAKSSTHPRRDSTSDTATSTPKTYKYTEDELATAYESAKNFLETKGPHLFDLLAATAKTNDQVVKVSSTHDLSKTLHHGTTKTSSSTLESKVESTA